MRLYILMEDDPYGYNFKALPIGVFTEDEKKKVEESLKRDYWFFWESFELNEKPNGIK